MINIQGGTAKDHSINLCDTCKYAIKREDRDGNISIKCQAFGARIGTRTLECSHYLHVSHPYLYEMKEISWILKTTGSKKMGFVPFSSLSHEEQKKVGDSL